MGILPKIGVNIKKIETTTPSLLCNQTNPRSFKSNKPIVPLLVQYPVVAAPPPFPKLNARSSPRRPSRLLDGLDGGLPGLLERSQKKKTIREIRWLNAVLYSYLLHFRQYLMRSYVTTYITDVTCYK